MSEIEILARAVVLDGHHVLLARCKGSAITFLPGGHVRPGEGLVAALEREMQEELGVSCQVESYLGAVEHTWTDPAGQHFEINHYFLVHGDRLTRSSDLAALEDNLEFHWAHQQDLESWNLMPGPVRELVRRLIRGRREIWWGTTI
jgi:8-oxo-dGTP diphosphatase